VGTVHEFETHLVSRATFGWTPQVERDVLDVGWEAWLDAQLAPTTIADPVVQGMVDHYLTLGNTNLQNEALKDTVEDFWLLIGGELAHSTLLRALYSRRHLYEVMVEFWTNHFNLNLDEDPWFHFLTVDNRTVARAHALGRFADLLQASAHSPAMLVYLDNFVSDANSEEGVNENYGRELLELHSMGIIDGVQPYTEDDMRGVALILSGWSVDEDQQVFRFKSWMHHTGPVSVLGGAFSTPGRTGTAGLQDGVALIDVIAHHPETARYLAYKLCRRFVSDTPPPGLVDSAAQVYLDHDTAIAPVLHHVFHSPEFAAAPGAKVRRGFEVFAAYLRSLRSDVTSDPVGQLSRYIHSPGWGMLERLGQRLWGRTTPDGYPDTGPDWISADGLLRRWETAGTLTATWLANYTPDLEGVLRPTGGTLDAWITGVAARLLGVVDGDPGHGLRDVPGWVEDPVRWIVSHGYAAGYPDHTFRPNTDISRGQVVNMLWKIEGSPVESADHGLSDVPPWCAAAVRWAVAQGHMSGYRDGTFRPDRPITRGQVVTSTWKIAGSPTGFPGHGLSDVPGWCDPAVRWAVAHDHMDGYAGGTFRPNRSITRGQVARMLYRIHDPVPDLLTPTERSACLSLFSDTGVGAGDITPDWLVDWKGHDLMTFLLSLPRFQRR
jgi:Protein of unknown function (DUF1800)/S-layer homology domain